MDVNTMQNLVVDNSIKISKSKRRNEKQRLKKKALKKNGEEIGDRMNNNLVSSDTMRDHIVANNESNGNLLKTDLTVQPLIEHPKDDTGSMGKKKAVEKNGEEIGHQMGNNLEVSDTMKDHKVANNESNVNLVKPDLIVQPEVQHPNMDTSSMEQILEGNLDIKKKNKKKNEKTIIEVEVQSMDQVKTEGNVTEGNSNIKEKKMEKNENKTNGKDEVPTMDRIKAAAVLIQKVIERYVTDTSSRLNISEENSNKEKKKNENETNYTVLSMDRIKAIAALIQNIAEGIVPDMSSVEKLRSMNRIKAAALLIEDIAEVNISSKGKWKPEDQWKEKNDKKAKIEDEIQRMNLAGPILNLHLSDNDKKLDGKPIDKEDGRCHSDPKMVNTSISSSDLVPGTYNPMDLLNNEAIVLSDVGQIETDTVLVENLAEANVTGKRKRKQKNKEKIEDEIQAISLAGPISNLHVSDVNHGGKADGKLRTEFTDKCGYRANVDTGLIENIAEANVAGEKKERKSKKVKINDEIQTINLAGPNSNLHVSDVNHGGKVDDKLRAEFAEKEYGFCHSDPKMVNPSISSPNLVPGTEKPLELLKHEAVLLSGVEQINVDTGLTESIAGANVTGEKKKRKSKKAKIKDEIETINLAGPISNLHVSDVNHERKVDDKLRTQFADNEHGLCHSDPKMVNPSISSSHLVPITENPLDLLAHEAVLLSALEQINVETGLTENIAEANVTSEKKKRRSKKAKIKDENHGGKIDGKTIDKEDGHNGKFEYGLTEVKDKVTLYKGKGSAEKSSELSTRDFEANKISSSCGVKDAEILCPKMAQVAPKRRKLLVLDLNGLLADIIKGPARLGGDAHRLGRAIFKRPFYEDFLNFCFENFDVAIWSSRSKRIIDQVVDYLLGDLQNKLLFCWDMRHVTQTGVKTLEDKHKPLVCKELKKVWEINNPCPRWKKGEYNESNTLLLDDSPYKALLNPPHTAIFPNSYHYGDKNDNSLGPGGDLRVYLEGLVKCENVQKYVEQHPFGQRAITDKSLSWEFYDKVLQKMSKRWTDRTTAPVVTVSQDVQMNST